MTACLCFRFFTVTPPRICSYLHATTDVPGNSVGLRTPPTRTSSPSSRPAFHHFSHLPTRSLLAALRLLALTGSNLAEARRASRCPASSSMSTDAAHRSMSRSARASSCSASTCAASRGGRRAPRGQSSPCRPTCTWRRRARPAPRCCRDCPACSASEVGRASPDATRGQRRGRPASARTTRLPRAGVSRLMSIDRFASIAVEGRPARGTDPARKASEMNYTTAVFWALQDFDSCGTHMVKPTSCQRRWACSPARWVGCPWCRGTWTGWSRCRRARRPTRGGPAGRADANSTCERRTKRGYSVSARQG